jgi:hypothetical protein
MTYTIRTVKSAVELRTKLSRAFELEQWNTCPDDAEAFLALDPTGFFVGELDGVPISFIAAVKYDTLSFLGLYFVEPSYRGKMYGRKIWDYAWATIHDKVVALDGVETMVDKYKTMNFVKYCPFSGYRFNTKQFAQQIVENKVEPVSDIQAVIQYDKMIFGQDRSTLLKVWLRKNVSALVVKNENGEICGLGMMRKANEGYRLALYANSYQIAHDIIVSHCQSLDDTVDIDLPHNNKEAMQLLQKYKMQFIDDLTRMLCYHNSALTHSMRIDLIYGITSWEIG